LSVKPHFGEAILAGTKRFEFRRSLYRCSNVEIIVLYASSPVQRVIGEFRVANILALAPDELWRATHRWSGIDRAYFDEYFDGRALGYALQVGQRRTYRTPKLLRRDFGIAHPPQSFCYLA
jgi:predicted transcriptional regulator